MIGLNVSNTRNPQHDDGHAWIVERIRDTWFGLSYHDAYARQVRAENDSHLILVDGWIFNAPGYEEQADFTLEQYLTHGSDLPYYLNGQFNVLIVAKDSGDFLYTNDIFSFRKHFYHQSPGRLMINPDVDRIAGELDTLTLNDDHLVKNLQLPRYIKPDETFIQEIGQFPPATIFSRETGLLSYDLKEVRRRYVPSGPVGVDEIIQSVDRAVNEVHRGDRILLELSGGLDSRFLLETLIKNKIRTETLTYGDLKCDEVVFAREVARALNITHHEVETTPADFLVQAERYIRNTCGLDIYVQGAVYEVFKRLPVLDRLNGYVIDTGWAMDLFLGAYNMHDPSKTRPNMITKDKSRSYEIENVFEFTLSHRTYSVIALRQAAHREHLEDRYSMYEYTNYFTMLQLDMDELRDNEFYHKLAKIQIQHSFHVPLHLTRYPLSLPPRYWKQAAEALLEHEKLALEGSIAAGKPIHHHRYYTDYDMWLRYDVDWIKLMERHLLAGDSLLTQRYIDRELVEATIADHREGRGSKIRDLIRWISTAMLAHAYRDKIEGEEIA